MGQSSSSHHTSDPVQVLKTQVAIDAYLVSDMIHIFWCMLPKLKVRVQSRIGEIGRKMVSIQFKEVAWNDKLLHCQILIYLTLIDAFEIKANTFWSSLVSIHFFIATTFSVRFKVHKMFHFFTRAELTAFAFISGPTSTNALNFTSSIPQQPST